MFDLAPALRSGEKRDPGLHGPSVAVSARTPGAWTDEQASNK